MKTVFVFIISLFVLTSTFGQRGGQHGPRGGERGIAAFADQLDLTATQKKQFAQLKAAVREKTQDLRNQKLTVKERKEKSRVIHQQSQEKAQSILTANQRKKLSELKAARREAHQNSPQAKQRKETRKKANNYRKETIRPAVQKARAEFDTEISAQDRKEIDRLRAVMSTRPGKDRKKGENPKAGQVNPEARMKQRAAKKEAHLAWKESHAADFASLKKLTEKYRPTIKAKFASMTDEREQWKKDLKNIREEGRQKPTPEAQKAAPGLRKKRRGKVAERRKKINEMKPSSFLLMDFE